MTATAADYGPAFGYGPAPEAPVFVTTTDLVTRWGIDRKTILGAIKAGEVPATKVGRRLLIPLRWVESRERGT